MTAEKISRQYVNLSKIKSNPNNPRIIKDDAFKKLVQSLKDFPEMIEAREIVVNKDMTILGGNMRYRAAKEAQQTGEVVNISCAIGDEMVDGLPYSEIVEIARKYIEGVGGFEKFAEWGLV